MSEENKNIEPEQPAENIPEVEQSEITLSSEATTASEENILPGAEANTTNDQLSTTNSQFSTEQEMEVHHHTHPAHGKKNWKSYFWEFLMLFLAVFCGFLAENQREHFIEKKRAVEYVKDLLFDLSKDTARLTDDITYYSWRENTIDSLIDLLSTGKKEYEGVKLLPKLRGLDTWRVPVGFSNTYDDLKSSGLLRYFTHSGIAGKLKTYYQGYLNLFYFEDELAQYAKQVCEPFLDKHFEGKYYVTQNTGRYSQLLFPIPQGTKIMVPDSIRKNLLNIAVRMRYKKISTETVSSFCENQKRMSNELIILLKKEYHLE